MADLPQQSMAPPAPQKKKWGVFRIIIVVSILIVILGAFFYVWANVKHPDWFDNGVNETGTNQTGIPPPAGEQGNTNIWKVIAFIVIGGLVITVGYLIYRAMSKGPKAIEFSKIPVSPDRALALFKQHFCINYNIQARYDNTEKTFIPVNERAIVINDKLPYYHTATGDNFLLVETEVKEGTQQGIHTVIIPIDRGEEVIEKGYYRIDTHTPRFQFSLNRVNYPMSSMADKQDRLRMAYLDRLESSGQGTPEAMERVITPATQPNVITTPLDQQGEEGMPPTPPRYPTTYRRRYQPRSRYYRR